MDNKNKPNNPSPWPVCADCHTADEEAGLAADTEATRPPFGAVPDGETGWEQLEVSRDLGPRGAEVLRQACAAYARAMERAQAQPEAKK